MVVSLPCPTTSQISKLASLRAGRISLPASLSVTIYSPQIDKGKAMTEQPYLGVDEAVIYAEERALKGFQGQAETDIRGALLRASEQIDASFIFSGSPASATQKRGWPRTGVRDLGGQEIGDIPPVIYQAVVELALAYLSSEADAEILLGQRGHIQTEKIGDISVSYQNSPASRRARLYQLLHPLLQPASHTRIIRT